jgi:hypothetical protein
MDRAAAKKGRQPLVPFAGSERSQLRRLKSAAAKAAEVKRWANRQAVRGIDPGALDGRDDPVHSFVQLLPKLQPGTHARGMGVQRAKKTQGGFGRPLLLGLPRALSRSAGPAAILDPFSSRPGVAGAKCLILLALRRGLEPLFSP